MSDGFAKSWIVLHAFLLSEQEQPELDGVHAKPTMSKIDRPETNSSATDSGVPHPDTLTP